MNDKQAEAEATVMKIYKESGPDIENLYERTWVNHLAWSLLVLSLGFIVWLVIALANAENQREALATKKCMDRVFPGEIDTKCLRTVHAREHWWQNVGYALTHTSPEK